MVAVSDRALVQRINRKLKTEGETLKRPRGHSNPQLGDYYVLDIYGNYVTQMDVDLESFGRELGVLKPFESLKTE